MESDKIEFKELLNDKFEKEVVAFLNSNSGGSIYIGVKDNGEIIGIENIDKTMLEIKDRIRNRIFHDLGFVERFGTGIRRVLRVYPKGIFKFSDNFIRVKYTIQ